VHFFSNSFIDRKKEVDLFWIKEIIKKLLLERIFLIGIARSLGVSMGYKILSILFIALSLVRCEFYQKHLPI